MGRANKIPFLYTSLLYLCGFFLFLEWLYPIGEFTNIKNLSIFIIYAIFCFLIFVFNMRWWITMLIKGIGLLVIINVLFTNDPIWGDFSFQALYLELSMNITYLFSGNWYHITDIFRSILFLLLIWMISYLIYYWFIVMKRILLFVLLTFIYITLIDTFIFYDSSFSIVRIFIIFLLVLVISDIFRSILFLLLIWMISYLIYYWFIVMKRILLFVLLTFIYITLIDTFTFYDASFTIVRIFIISFIALGMANFFKEIENQQIIFSWMKNWQKWMIPIIGVVFLTALLGYVAPKYGPQWPDPVPFLQGAVDYNNYGLNKNGNRSGYGDDDSHLGGSFLQDHTVVFHAITKHREYWRVETKDFYTGKGWEGPSKDYGALNVHLGFMANFSQNVLVEYNKAFIEFKESASIDKLVYPYGLVDVGILQGPDLLADQSSGAIQKQTKNNQANEEYLLHYEKPLFDLEMLRSTSEVDPQAILDQYTNVPEALPDRIGDLARDITASASNRYDQAQAIERYFGRNGFVYETENVPFPEEDQDYVDQFLFDTQAGYCDNYSTAMVVMLRTLDIPARWVKGFTGGEKIANKLEEEELFDIYEVTNANAHSWVEVYFPEIGWVPFEPTQGFTNPIDFVEASEDVEDQEENQVENDLEEENINIPEQDIPEIEDQPEEANVVEDEVKGKKMNLRSEERRVG